MLAVLAAGVLGLGCGPEQAPAQFASSAVEDRVRSEFDAAIAAGTTEALNAFIRKHREHPLAINAMSRRNDLLRAQGYEAPAGPIPLPVDPDVAVQGEFDGLAARGTAEAYELFIARHPDNRLADVARERLRKLK